MSAKYRLPLILGQHRPTQQSHGLFATAKLLVVIRSDLRNRHCDLPYLLQILDAQQSVCKHKVHVASGVASYGALGHWGTCHPPPLNL